MISCVPSVLCVSNTMRNAAKEKATLCGVSPSAFVCAFIIEEPAKRGQ